jgi:serine/threonine-protein kinase
MTHVEESRRIGPYLLLEEIGHGATSIVYEAVDTQNDRRVTLKLLEPSAASAADPAYDAVRIQRMEREAALLIRISHPNVVRVLDYGTIDGADGDLPIAFVAMERVRGETLRDRLSHPKPLTVYEVGAILDQAAAGIDAIHAAGVVHRDIKPGNLLITAEGAIKIIDFGAAHCAQEGPWRGDIIGSPTYMSPEQAIGMAPAYDSDIWALGVVLYEMLTRQPPFVGEDMQQTLYSIAYGGPPLIPTDLPQPIQSVLTRSLARNPALRYSDGGGMAQAFREAVETAVAASVGSAAAHAHGVPVVLAPRETPRLAPTRRTRSRRTSVLALVASSVGVAALIALAAAAAVMHREEARLSDGGRPRRPTHHTTPSQPHEQERRSSVSSGTSLVARDSSAPDSASVSAGVVPGTAFGPTSKNLADRHSVAVGTASSSALPEVAAARPATVAMPVTPAAVKVRPALSASTARPAALVAARLGVAAAVAGPRVGGDTPSADATPQTETTSANSPRTFGDRPSTASIVETSHATSSGVSTTQATGDQPESQTRIAGIWHGSYAGSPATLTLSPADPQTGQFQGTLELQRADGPTRVVIDGQLGSDGTVTLQPVDDGPAAAAQPAFPTAHGHLGSSNLSIEDQRSPSGAHAQVWTFLR